MLYAFVICVLLALITGVMGLTDVMHQGRGTLHILFALFMACWMLLGGCMIYLAAHARRRAQQSGSGSRYRGHLLHRTATVELPSSRRVEQRISSPGGGMLYWIVLLLVLAIIAGILGFGGIMHAAIGVAQILFVIFLILLVISIIVAVLRGRRTS